MHSATFPDAIRRSIALSIPSLKQRLAGLRLRTALEKELRATLDARGFLEIRPSLLTPAPGFEPHIRPFEIRSWRDAQTAAFLPTSPEFLLKRIVAQGHAEGLVDFERIFSLTPVFRSEPVSPIHRPEFTLLEWYRVGPDADVTTLEDCRALIQGSIAAAEAVGVMCPPTLRAEWVRWSIPEKFESELGIDLGATASHEALWLECRKRGFLPKNTDDSALNHDWDDLYFRLWLNVLEPSLPKDAPCVVEHYPPSQAALSELRIDAKGRPWARRYELYIAGIEIANAFFELRDAQTHVDRYSEEMRIRERAYGETFPKTPLDEGFIQSLKHPGLPACAGVALGVDRLIQVVGGLDSIHQTFAWDIEFSGGAPS